MRGPADFIAAMVLGAASFGGFVAWALAMFGVYGRTCTRIARGFAAAAVLWAIYWVAR